MKRPSPSMTVALMALFIALGSTATAATVLIKSSSQIKDGAVKRQDIARNAIDSDRVKNNTLTEDDLAGSLRSSLSASTASEAIRKVGPEELNDGANAVILELKDLEPGAYVLFAKSTLFAPANRGGLLQEGRSVSAYCQLDAGGAVDDARALISGPGANAPGTLNMQLTQNLGERTTVELRCAAEGSDWRAADSSIIAIKVADTQRRDGTPPTP